MIRFLILRVLVPLILFLIIRAVLRSIFSGAPSGGRQHDRAKVPAGGELRKDPICGTYVSMATSLSHSVNGKTHYFCSQKCRDKYV